MQLSRPVLAGLIAFIGPLASAGEILVDPGGGGDASTVSDAIGMAGPGDTVLVYPGTYVEDVVLDATPLQVVAQTPGTVAIEGSITVRLIGPGDRVLLDGLDVSGATELFRTNQDTTLVLENCVGEVQIQRCSFTGAAADDGVDFALGGYGAEIEDCDRVLARRTVFLGGNGYESPPLSCNGSRGADAVRISGSRVAMWGVEARGGNGMSCTFDFGEGPGMGGRGLQCAGSEVFLSGTLIRGGWGGGNGDVIGTPGADGGDGLVVSAGSTVYSIDSVRQGGSGGNSATGSSGDPGAPIVGASLVQDLPGESEDHDSALFVRAQSIHALEVRGEAGATAFLVIRDTVPFVLDTIGSTPSGPGPGGPGSATSIGTLPVVGVNPTRVGVRGIPLGTIPASGVLDASVGIPAVPPASTAFALDFEVVVVGSAGRSTFGAPQRVLLLNCPNLLPDCNADGRGDLCQLLEGAPDCDLDGRLDECQVDCNGNGVADVCDLASGSSQDRNGNGVPDECEPSGSTWVVDAAAAPGGNGSPAAPFGNLASAFSVALTGDEILLRDGVYSGPANRNLDFDRRGLKVRGVNGPSACIIDLEEAGRAFFFDLNEEAPGALIQGITIRDGNVLGLIGDQRRGGAILALGARPTVLDCVFESNSANEGGAIYFNTGNSMQPRVERCEFRDNLATEGGAIHAFGAGCVVEDSLFLRNHAQDLGGAIFARGSVLNPFVASRCRFVENAAGNSGGAFYGSGGLLGPPIDIFRLYQCLFVGNSATTGGALSGAGAGAIAISQSTLVGNHANGIGGAVGIRFGMNVRAQNSILHGNTGSFGPQVGLQGSSFFEVEWSNLDGGITGVWLSGGGVAVAGSGLVDLDPLFVDPDGLDGQLGTFLDNDYRLSAGSPSVDAGSVGLIPADLSDVDQDIDLAEPVPLDLDGSPRRVDDPATTDTGIGGPPVVDHGPYER